MKNVQKDLHIATSKNYLPDEIVFLLRSSGYVVTRYISKDVDTLENKRITCVYLKPRRG